MHKQHPQTAYRKYAILIGTIFDNCDKKYNQLEKALLSLLTVREMCRMRRVSRQF